MDQVQVACPHCKATGGIHRVDEVDLRGGPYWSCRYCGHTIEDTPPPFIAEDGSSGGERKIVGPTFKTGRHIGAKS